jgi:hypothetical protein
MVTAQVATTLLDKLDTLATTLVAVQLAALVIQVATVTLAVILTQDTQAARTTHTTLIPLVTDTVVVTTELVTTNTKSS